MQNAKTVGRVIAVLFLAQGVIAPITNFVLQAPLTTPPGFLENAAPHAADIRLSAVLSVLSGIIWIGIAATALPVFRTLNDRAALAFLALAVVLFSGMLTEGFAVRAMVSLSEAYAASGAQDPAAFAAAAALVRSLRNSAHFTNLLVSGIALLVFYGLLFRFALVPRVISGFGLLAVAVLIVGAVIPLLGHRSIMLLFMPMGPAQLALVAWLLVKGLRPLGVQ